MSKSDAVSTFFSGLGASIKGIVKMMLQSRRCTVRPADHGEACRPLIIMGNGPSLADTMATDMATLTSTPTMAVNFAANAPEFHQLKPRYYILADPHFFAPAGDKNVERLWRNITAVTWPMTLYVPARCQRSVPQMPQNVTVEYFNPVGVEGFRWLTNLAYRIGRGMPRPRNVLIPALMVGIRLGYNRIYIVGADHSWMRTLSVNERNEVVSIQPHFYSDNHQEAARVASVYRDIPLHNVIMSFYVAFEAYHRIAAYGRHRGVKIYNATPSSMIDAFPREPLPSVGS